MVLCFGFASLATLLPSLYIIPIALGMILGTVLIGYRAGIVLTIPLALLFSGITSISSSTTFYDVVLIMSNTLSCGAATVWFLKGRPQRLRVLVSGLIAAVLLAVGLGLPIVYVGMFLSQVNLQADKWKLGKGRPVYTVTLRSRDFTVISDQKAGEAVTVDWKDAAQAFRMPGCIYLYASPAKAFLLPDGQADAPDREVWAMIMTHLGADKCRISPLLQLTQKDLNHRR